MATGENQLYRLHFCILSNKKTYQGTLRTQDSPPIGSETSLGPSMDPTGPLKSMVPDTIILKPFSGRVYHFYIAHYLDPPIILEHLFGYCGTLSGLKEPSRTFTDPIMDPVRQISGDP